MKYRLNIPEILVLIGSYIVCAHAAHGQLDGILFTSPDERAYLDYLRQEFLQNSQETGFDIDALEVPQIPSVLDPQGGNLQESGPVEFTLGGVITVGRASRSVWLNGQLLAEHALPENFRIETDGPSHFLQINQGTQTFRLRPGQTLNIRTGIIMERYQQGEHTSFLPDVKEMAKASSPEADAVEDNTESGARAVAVQAGVDEVEPELKLEDLNTADLAEMIQALQAREDNDNALP